MDQVRIHQQIFLNLTHFHQHLTSQVIAMTNIQHVLVMVMTLGQALTNKVVKFQEKWDASQMPINLQDYMLHPLFGSITRGTQCS